MAPEAVLSGVVSQLANLLQQEVAFLHGVRNRIEWVKTELQTLQGFLKVAESRRRRGDERVENWIREVRDVAYEVEDIIDKVKFLAERRRQRRGFMGSLSRYPFKAFELITLHKIGSEIEKIKGKIHHISEKRATYGIPNLGESGVDKGSDRDNDLQALRQFPPHFFDDTGVIGFEDDKKQLVDLLVDPEKENRCVISIVGMGGLGKTTLARKVFNDPEIKKHFHTFAWVSVSQEYRGLQLLKDIMKKVNTGITPQQLERLGEEDVRETLYNILRDKKYLVVMDDVWAVDVWRQIHQVFPNGNNGSRILLTTRNIEVARDAEPWIPPHELHLLNDTYSSELFCRKAFPPNQDVPAELKELAQQLARRCGGLPLALVVLGGLLSRKDRNYDTWSKVAQSMNWQSSGGQECISILGLSYGDLPYQLKPCFLYITAFPEDSVISVSKLARLWIAEGFIMQDQRRTMEDTARGWLDELVQRCMIQVVERSMAHGWVKSIRIHDMLRELGMSEAEKDGFLHVCCSDMAVSNGTSGHRAAFRNYINDEIADSSPRLRTLLGGASMGRFLNGLKLLRVLDLEGATYLEELPKQIGKMNHLRYLGLRRTGLKSLPSSIGHLLNLHTLDVRDTLIYRLPKSFWKIRTLRHVYINYVLFLSTPLSGKHRNLQSLQITIVPAWTPDVMDMMRLQGIAFMRKWFPNEDIERAFRKSLGRALEKMDSLISLTLNISQIVGNLILPLSWLGQDPMPVVEKLRNLRFLQVQEAYTGKVMSCSAGGFPRLQHLILLELGNLEEWRVEVGAMPSLSRLTIVGCYKLKMLPEGLQHVTTLRELRLDSMTPEFNERVRNEDGYKVRHVPSIIFEDEK